MNQTFERIKKILESVKEGAYVVFVVILILIMLYFINAV